MVALMDTKYVEEDGLGDWHPARRPDSNGLARDEQMTKVIQQSLMDEQAQENVSMPKVVMSSEYPSTLPHESAPEKDEGEGPDSDMARSSMLSPESLNSESVSARESKDVTEYERGLGSGEQVDDGTSLFPLANQNLEGLQHQTSLDTTAGESLGSDHERPNLSPDSTQNDQDFAPTSSSSKMLGAAYADLNRFNRTNSFPIVPPRPNSSRIPKSLPHSQAEDIMEDFEEGTAMCDQGFSEIPASPVKSIDSTLDTLPDYLGKAQGDFFSSSAILRDTRMTSPLDEEARYEEGMPLMHSGTNKEKGFLDGSQSPASQAGPPGFLQSGEEDFFNGSVESVSEREDVFRPQALDRKTTSQVLNSMQYPPGKEVQNELQQFVEGPTLENLPETGPADSPSSNISEAQPEQTIDISNTSTKEEDLAAKWQAALDDDELLDEDNEADPSNLFGDDEEGFLDDLDTVRVQSPLYSSAEPAYNAGAKREPSDAQSTAYHYGSLPANIRPQMPSTTQSFADKAKGGYTSPYDLPMDVTRPKRRNLTQQNRPGSSKAFTDNRPSAPPRSSSMFVSGSPVPGSHPPLPLLSKQPSAAPSPPPLNSATSTLKSKDNAGSFFEELPSVKPRSSIGPARSYTPATSQNPNSQLPPLPPPIGQVSNTRRPASSYNSSSPGHGLLPPRRTSPLSSPGPAGASVPSVNLRYSPAPTAQANISTSQMRYAASLASGSGPPPPADVPFQPRTSSPLARNNAVRSNEAIDVAPVNGISDYGNNPKTEVFAGQPPTATAASSSSVPDPSLLGQTSKYAANQTAISDLGAVHDSDYSSHVSPPLPPKSRYEPATNASTHAQAEHAHVPDQSMSNEHSTGFEAAYPVSVPAGFAPPRRSQTQSPSAVFSRPYLPSKIGDVYQRPASVNDRALPPQARVNLDTLPHSTLRPKGFSQPVDYIKPTDGREYDPLERWKGCPVFRFGFGGTVVTSFPRIVQRYATGHNRSLMKCSPGEIKVQSRQRYPFDNNLVSFPGPLKTKGKKRDVLEWLQQRILHFEQVYGAIDPSPILPDQRKRHEEKILLWKTVKTLVEFDGVIEGKATAEAAVRLILSPEVAEGSTNDLSLSSNSELLGISKANGSRSVPAFTEIGDIESLRRILIQGQREKAVWHALDRRLWAHAMIISSTMDNKIWKQVLQEFIRQEVKSLGNNTESLAALYQIFAGNWEESIDELVPPSARAGLQFVSKAAGTGPTRNALDGLDRWRETLALALSNRTHDDGQALVALGRLLSGYGRVEAAHICFISAKSAGVLGGADDPQAGIALLGADHIQDTYGFGRDLDSILLTEIYEFACTLLAPSPSTTLSPHLQAYKLYHAMNLAEYGLRTEAQEYCSVVTSAIKSTTKLSPYYHSVLWAALDDLTNRLRQAPSVGSTSWMSKPSLDKVSGSFLSRVNQFIAGDESDGDSAVSGKGTDPAAGPFAGVTGDTPNISRAPSSSDLYSSYPSQPPLTSGVVQASRVGPYNPQGQYTPRTSFEQSHGNIQDNRGRKEALRPQPLNMSRPNSSGSIYQLPPQQSAKSSYQPLSQTSAYSSQQGSYPTPPSLPDSTEIVSSQALSPSYGQESYHATPPPDPQTSYSSYEASSDLQPDRRQVTETSYLTSVTPAYEHSSISYQPPLSAAGPLSSDQPSSSYEPPSYVSYDADTQNDEPSPDQGKPKKKSFMDDDDDDYEARAAALLKQEKARKDREADEAFRKAAEADAQKGPDLKPKKSGWLGGWFGGGKKDGDLSSASNAANAPIKAKLGEESSFVYDKELKKWVNKKAGSEAPTAAAPVPPPPKGPPSRAVSASGAPPIRKDVDAPPVPPLPVAAQGMATPPISVTGPPGAPRSVHGSNTPSRTASPALAQSEQSGATNPSLAGPPSVPPSRPATGMSNASSIDDLIGAPQARKGGTIKKSKKGRGYIDVMAK